MPSLAQLLAIKIKSSGLAVTAAAKKAGISFPSFHAALHGKSSPNKRSVNKYAAFLGISAAEVQGASGKPATTAKGDKAAKKGKKAAKKAMKATKPKKAKKPGRRGRPPGSKNKVSAKSSPKVDRKALAALGASFKKATALLNKAGKLLSKLA